MFQPTDKSAESLSSDSNGKSRFPIEELQEALEIDSVPVVEDFVDIEIDHDVTERHFDDHRFVARFFAGVTLAIGLITIAPTVYFVVNWFAIDSTLPIPRWTFLMVFLGLLHLVYAIYVLQVSDYSTLQMLALFQLALVCVYGFVVAAVLLDAQQGDVVRFLQLPYGLTRTAAIWCGAMFSITTLCCYLSGRESMMWKKRLEHRAVNR